jgi:hypothetical protein
LAISGIILEKHPNTFGAAFHAWPAAARYQGAGVTPAPFNRSML